jgi:hypothetical protein
MDWDLSLPFDLLIKLEERLPRYLVWLIRPFTLIAGIVDILWQLRRAVLRVAVPLLLAGWLGKLLMEQLPPDTGATAMLLILGLAVWHLYQTESLRAQIKRLDNDIEGALIELNEAVRAVTPEIEG